MDGISLFVIAVLFLALVTIFAGVLSNAAKAAVALPSKTPPIGHTSPETQTAWDTYPDFGLLLGGGDLGMGIDLTIACAGCPSG